MNTSAKKVISGAIFILTTFFLCSNASAKLINAVASGGAFSLTAKHQDVKINGQLVHAIIYSDDNGAALPLDGDNAYADGIPILTMNLNVGDTVVCKFTNLLPKGETPEGASIHWHGVELDNDSDGTAVTQDMVPEGGTYTYRFTVKRPGQFWFHSHMVPGDTLFAGLYGVIYVKTPCENAVSIGGKPLPGQDGMNTFTLAMSDTEFLDADFTNPVGPVGSLDNPTGRSWTKGTVGRKGGTPAKFQTINEWIHDCAPVDNAQTQCLYAANPGNVVLVNGYNPSAALPPNVGDPLRFEVSIGQVIRLKLYNEALTRTFYLKMQDKDGTPINLYRIGGQGGLLNNARLEGGFDRNAAAGDPIPGWDAAYDAGAILLSSGVRSEVVFTVPNDVNLQNSTMTLMAFQPDAVQFRLTQNVPASPYPVAFFRVGGGGAPANQPTIGTGTAILAGTACQVQKLSGPTNNFLNPPPCGGTNNSLIRLTQSGGAVSKPAIDTLPLAAGNPLDGNAGNGSWMQISPLPTTRYARVGDMLQIAVRNETQLAHPFHWHGFSFQPVAIVTNGGGALYTFDYNEFVDTWDVYAKQTLIFNVLLEDRGKMCDAATGGPVLMPCGDTGTGGAVGRWLYHCHIGAHGVLGMIGEFIVLGNGAVSKWDQPPDASTTGVDVLAAAGTGSQTVADDFLCQTNGWISGVHIWGSWLNDIYDPNVTFELKFWTDVPASPGHPSRPGWQIWEGMFPPGSYGSAPFFTVNPQEFFFDPSIPQVGNDHQIYQYDFALPECSRGIDSTNMNVQGGFYQYSGHTYWLSVTAITPNQFGWKSTPPGNRFNDDACWSPTSIGPHWTPLTYFPGHPYYSMPNNSMDMAFALDTAVTFPPPEPRPEITPIAPVLSASVSGGNLNVTWSGGGTLQYADDLAGPWTDLEAATSPYTAPADAPHRFYRVRVP